MPRSLGLPHQRKGPVGSHGAFASSAERLLELEVQLGTGHEEVALVVPSDRLEDIDGRPANGGEVPNETVEVIVVLIEADPQTL